MRIRPIQPDELPVFAGAASHSEHVGAVHDYGLRPLDQRLDADGMVLRC